jgi:hypothetical protein
MHQFCIDFCLAVFFNEENIYEIMLENDFFDQFSASIGFCVKNL